MKKRDLADFSAHTATTPDGHATLHLMVDGLQCAACVWLWIETVLRREPASSMPGST